MAENTDSQLLNENEIHNPIKKHLCFGQTNAETMQNNQKIGAIRNLKTIHHQQTQPRI